MEEGTEDPENPEDGEAESLDLPPEGEPYSRVEGIDLTPEEHQQVKDIAHGERLREIKQHERKYLVVGEGSDDGLADRRQVVYDLLDDRRSPPSVAFQLEDFGIEEEKLWARIFDILCGQATWIVSVLEDFDGGYVWELGLLYAPSYRDKVWVLRRRYPDPEVDREKFENGMAHSHIERLLESDRCIEWASEAELREAVEDIP